MRHRYIDFFINRVLPKILILAGVYLFFWSFYNGPQDVYFNGYRLIATGLLFLGIGEWLNHPKQVSLSLQSTYATKSLKELHNHRNPSSLGNLFDIAALILLCVGISKAFLP